MIFTATKHPVLNRGVPPDSFLTELIEWAKQAPNEIFAPNDNAMEVFTLIKPSLATPAGRDASGAAVYHWDSLLHRKAALLETMRCHAGFESSWNWKEGVDKTNATSMANKTGQETGIFQVSFDSENLGNQAMRPFAVEHGIDNVNDFIAKMKSNHPLAMDYYARLVRVNIRWAGPLIRGEILPCLRRDAMEEFQSLLSA